MPKLKTDGWSEHEGGPSRIFGPSTGPYAEIQLGDQIGLSQFGVHLERLPPGSKSSQRHWHQAEDEFVYLLSGELVLVEDAETLLRAGDAAGWKAGQSTAHCLENRSEADAVMLVVGTRTQEDIVHYPDHDVVLHNLKTGSVFTRSDGAPIDPED